MISVNKDMKRQNVVYSAYPKRIINFPPLKKGLLLSLTERCYELCHTRDVVDLLACWAGKVGKDETGMIWKAIPHCLMWCLWGERKARTFTGDSRSMPALKLYFLQSLFYWLKASRLVFSDSLIDMIDICTFCT